MRALTESELAEYQRRLRACDRAARAVRKSPDDPRAKLRLERATAARNAFVAPLIAEYPLPPRRVLHKAEYAWSGPSGHGRHVIVTEMELSYCDLSGPHYTRVRTVSDVGAPPIDNPRSPPDMMGCAWHAVGRLVVI